MIFIFKEFQVARKIFLAHTPSELFEHPPPRPPLPNKKKQEHEQLLLFAFQKYNKDCSDITMDD